MLFLRSLGHEVETAAQVGASRLDDAALAELAARRGAVLLTKDLDFGDLFVRGQLVQLVPIQIVLLRTRSGRPEALNAVLGVLVKAIDLTDPALRESLIVARERGYRIRGPDG